MIELGPGTGIDYIAGEAECAVVLSWSGESSREDPKYVRRGGDGAGLVGRGMTGALLKWSRLSRSFRLGRLGGHLPPSGPCGLFSLT